MDKFVIKFECFQSSISLLLAMDQYESSSLKYDSFELAQVNACFVFASLNRYTRVFKVPSL